MLQQPDISNLVDQKLPEHVDVIFFGTGLPETILASACSRSGMRVLLLDREKVYGGSWGTVNLNKIEEWAASKNVEVPMIEKKDLKNKYKDLIEKEEECGLVGAVKQINNIKTTWCSDSNKYMTADKNGDNDMESLQENLLKGAFLIDLYPKILLASGGLIETISGSEIANRPNIKSIAFGNGRDDVFGWDNLSDYDAHIVDEFNFFCLSFEILSEELEDLKDVLTFPFEKFMDICNINDNVKHYIDDIIGISSMKINTKQGVATICQYLRSFDRFAFSPYVVPVHGCGQVTLWFLKLCLHFKGMYCLGTSLEAIIEKGNKVSGVIANGQRINCSHLILGPEFVHSTYGAQPLDETQRTVVVSNSSVFRANTAKIHFDVLTKIAPQTSSRMTELGFGSCQAPEGFYISHLTSRMKNKESVNTCLESIYGQGDEADERPLPLWHLSFSVRSSSFVMNDNAPTNVAVMPPPDESFYFENLLHEVQNVFQKFWPEHDFLPRLRNLDGDFESKKPILDDTNNDEKCRQLQCDANRFHGELAICQFLKRKLELDLRRELRDICEEKNSLAKTVRDLRSKLEAAENVTVRMRTQQSSSEAKIKMLNDQLVKEEDEKANITRMNRRIENRLKESNHLLEEEKKHVQFFQEVAVRATEHLQKCRFEIDDLQEEVAREKAKAKQLERKTEELQESIVNLNAENTILKTSRPSIGDRARSVLAARQFGSHICLPEDNSVLIRLDDISVSDGRPASGFTSGSFGFQSDDGSEDSEVRKMNTSQASNSRSAHS